MPYKSEAVLPLLKQTLADLQTTYVDQFLIHWPTYNFDSEKMVPIAKPIHLLWREMEEC